MDSTQLDNALFFPITTIKPAIKATQWTESIGRMSMGGTDELPSLLQMSAVGAPCPHLPQRGSQLEECLVGACQAPFLLSLYMTLSSHSMQLPVSFYKFV